MRSRTVVGGSIAITVALLLSSCISEQQLVIDGSTVTVAVSQPFTSANPATTQGNTVGNVAVAAITRSGFTFYNDALELVRDESFGTIELVSQQPLRVRYTIAPGVQWSDGVPVDEADLLLAWAAYSGALNTPDIDTTVFRDPETGLLRDDYPADLVYFDATSRPQLSRASELPAFGESTVTLTYDEFFPDWELLFDVGVPAHIVAGRALGIDDPAEAKQAVLDAIVSGKRTDLAAISRFWNTGFAVSGMPDDPGILVSNGPYVVTDIVSDQSVTVTANPNYRGDRLPSFEEVTVRAIADPVDAALALGNGEVDVMSVAAGPEVVELLDGFDGVTVTASDGAIHEHLDLRFRESKNGTLDDPGLREAFLKTVPRQELLESLIVPLNPDGELRDSFVVYPGSPGYDAVTEANGLDRRYGEVDIPRASALVAGSGVAEPRVCILFDSDNPRRVATFELIRSSAERAGFVVEDCGSPDWGALLSEPYHYDAALFGWQVSGLGVTNTVETFRTGGLNNYSGYANAEVDELLDELSVTIDAERRLEIQLAVDRILARDAYGLPLFQLPLVTAARDTVVGVSTVPWAPGVVWNVWEWAPPSADSSR